MRFALLILGLLALALSPRCWATTPQPVEVPITVSSPSPFPLSVSNNVLVSAQNQPFMMLGDSPWGLLALVPCPTGTPTCASTSGTNNWSTYLSGRASLGYNSILVLMICDGYALQNCSANNGILFDGRVPFTGNLGGCTQVNGPVDCYDVSTPNQAYFDELKSLVTLAATYSIQVMFVPLDTGQCNQGGKGNGSAWNLMVNNYNHNASSLAKFGAYLQNQFGSFANVAWIWGNDFSQLYCNQTADNIFYSIAYGVKSAETSSTAHVHTMQYISEVNGIAGVGSTTMDDPYNSGWQGIINLNLSYTCCPTYAAAYHGYQQQQGHSTITTFLGEANYEGEDNSGSQSGNIDSCGEAQLANAPFCPVRQRHQEWWAALSGSAAGQLFGSRPVYQFFPGWQNFLTDEGAIEFSYLWKFFTSRGWTKLVPDTDSTFVYCGNSGTGCGTFASLGTGGNNVTNNYVTGAKAHDGSFGVVYFPTNSKAATVAMLQLNGNVTAKWYDPTKEPTQAGNYTVICQPSATPCDVTTQTFSVPGTHLDGTSDWVLLLTSG